MRSSPKVGDPVLVWVGTMVPEAEGGIAVGGRVLQEGDPPWIDICVLGTHLPQMYRLKEIEPMTLDLCKKYALCPACLGYGAMGEVPLAAQLDEIADTCDACGGTGRAAMRVEMTRSPDGSTIKAQMKAMPHEAMRANGKEHCVACGLPFEGPLSELANHTA